MGVVPLPALNDWDAGVLEGVGDFVGIVERETGDAVDTFAVFFEKSPWTLSPSSGLMISRSRPFTAA